MCPAICVHTPHTLYFSACIVVKRDANKICYCLFCVHGSGGNVWLWVFICLYWLLAMNARIIMKWFDSFFRILFTQWYNISSWARIAMRLNYGKCWKCVKSTTKKNIEDYSMNKMSGNEWNMCTYCVRNKITWSQKFFFLHLYPCFYVL